MHRIRIVKMKKKLPAQKIFSFVALGFLILCLTANAWASFIAPKRVIIEDKQRTAAITIHNGSEKTLAYRFSWEHRAQTTDGKSVLLKEGETMPGYKPVESMLQFSPRQVILKPQQNQKVRILVKRPADLPDGEYRSHLLIRTEALDNPETESAGQQGLTGTLKINTNASIPVMLRHGKTTLSVKIKDAALITKGDRQYLQYNIENNSTRSVFAVPELDCIGAPPDTKPIMLNTARIYAESKTANLEPPIPLGVSLAPCSALKLRLVALNDFEFKRQTIAEINVRK